MKQLSAFQQLLFCLGGLLLFIGAVLPVFTTKGFALAFFAPGACLFAWMQWQSSYLGNSLIIKRLRRQQLLGAALLVLTALLLFTSWQHLPPARGDEWKLTLAIGAFLELYTAFRLPALLEKEEKGGL